MDHVDTILEQWRKERADLDVSSMEVVGRIKRLSQFFSREMEKTLSRFGLHLASFDVLATLLRSGPPYTLSPGDLMASTMVTSGTMTNRLDQLEKSGLIQRTQSETDKRSFLISLSDEGYDLINEVIKEHVNTQDQLTHALSKQEKAALNKALRTLTLYFEEDS